MTSVSVCLRHSVETLPCTSPAHCKIITLKLKRWRCWWEMEVNPGPGIWKTSSRLSWCLEGPLVKRSVFQIKTGLSFHSNKFIHWPKCKAFENTVHEPECCDTLIIWVLSFLRCGRSWRETYVCLSEAQKHCQSDSPLL